jgi:hypothetical protein
MPNVLSAPQLGNRLQTAEPGQMLVDENDVELRLTGQFARLPPKLRFGHVEGKRVAAKILRTMLRIVGESSTTSTRVANRTRIDAATRRVASARSAGLLAMASVPNGGVVSGALSSTVKGGFAAARAVDVSRATASY